MNADRSGRPSAGMVAFLTLLVLTGIGIAEAPPALSAKLEGILALLACSLGALQAGAQAILSWRRGRRLLAFLLALLCLILALLTLAAIGALAGASAWPVEGRNR